MNNKRKIDTLITDFFKSTIKKETNIKNNNPCLECGINMGNSNRQLCGKWYCYGILDK